MSKPYVATIDFGSDGFSNACTVCVGEGSWVTFIADDGVWQVAGTRVAIGVRDLEVCLALVKRAVHMYAPLVPGSEGFV